MNVDALFTAYHVAIVGFLFNRCHERELAEDLAATVFYKVCMAAGGSRYRGEGAARSWLYAIAHDLWRDHLRLKYRRSHTSLDDAGDLAPHEERAYGSCAQYRIS